MIRRILISFLLQNLMKIFIGGDYVPQFRIQNMVEDGDYSFFNQVEHITKDNDFSIINLEAPIVSGNAKPIKKNGPNLKASPKVVESLKYAGFNVTTLANNHIMDYGAEGLKETHKELERGGILHVGTGKNLEDAGHILYLRRDDKTVAIINCCEHEFSIAKEDKPGANPLNPIRQFKAIKEAILNADYVIVIVHGGHELWQLPSPRMVETYRFFVEVGADAVINHHQHCFSGYEVYKGKPIFYGLGNFCFDKQNADLSWCEGYGVELNFSNDIAFKILPYLQNYEKPGISFLSEDSFSSCLEEINEIIKNRDLLYFETQKYYNTSKNYIKSILEPYNNRILKKLYSLGLLPSFIKGHKAKEIENIILCESHRDKLIHSFDN